MSNCSHSELIRLTHELDIFASFLHKQSLGMELLGPPRLPYSPGGATVRPTDEKLECSTLIFTFHIQQLYTPASNLKHKLIVPAAIPVVLPPPTCLSFHFFIFSCSILATFSLAGLFIRISNRFGCFKMCLFAVFLSNMKMFFYNMNH